MFYLSSSHSQVQQLSDHFNIFAFSLKKPNSD